MQTGEKSARVLELTENIIRQNPAHYSAWCVSATACDRADLIVLRQYRYETLLSLLPPQVKDAEAGVQPDIPPQLAAELALMDELAVTFLKTYQVWHHRRLLVPLARQPRRELAFIQRGLAADAKNYHTWSYRQWLLAACYGPGAATDPATTDAVLDEAPTVWAAELDFVDAALAQDVRNNSAWYHRFFVVYGVRGQADSEAERARIFRRELMCAAFIHTFIPQC